MSKNSLVDLSKVKELYDGNIRKFGNTAESVGWGTIDKQNLRFEKLMSVLNLDDSSFSLNELGCGYGELVKFCAYNDLDLGDYYGYDISAEMIAAAEKYLDGNESIQLFQQSTLSTQADYSIASGIFNVRFDHSKDSWETYIKMSLKNMFEYSDKGFAFNLLTKYVDFEAENLFYADPAVFFDFCKSELGGHVNLLHDYPLYEWTMTVQK